MIILAGALVVLGVCLAMVWPRDEGPEYNGRTLSEWINRALSANYPDENYLETEAEALESIRAIGGEGTPYLLKWIQYDPPKWRRNLEGLVSRLPPGMLRTGFARAVHRRRSRAIDAMWTLMQIEPEDSKSVVVELERLSRDLKRPQTAKRAEWVLIYKEWGQ